MNNTILLAFQSFAEIVGWTILHSIWQITVVALVLKLLLVWTAKYGATIRYALCICALVLATFWSVQTFLGEFNTTPTFEYPTESKAAENAFQPVIAGTEIAFSPSSFITKMNRQTTVFITPLMPFLAVFWLLGLLFFASRILIGLFRLHYFTNNGIQALPNVWDARLAQLVQLTGIQRPISVCLSTLVETPITYRFFRPIILLPISLFTGLNDEQIEVLLLHELAHIKRQDYLVNLLQSCIEVLFFYHPLIWWMSKQVRLEREYCCDDKVMNLRHNPMLYAQTLTQIQRQYYSLKTKLAMSATGNTGDFSKRIFRLFEQKEPYATLRNSIAALLLLFLSGGIMAFYPTYPTTSNQLDTLVIIQDTIPKKLHQHTDGSTETSAATAKTLEQEKEVAALQLKLVELEKELHQKIKTLKEEKSKDEQLNEVRLEQLQDDAIQLKKALHEKTKQLKELTNNAPNEFQLNTDKKEVLHLKSGNGDRFTLKMLEGKNPIIYLDNEPYKRWKIDNGGTLIVDIPTEEVYAVNVFKGEKAVALFGLKASDGVVYIYTQANPHVLELSKDKLQESKDNDFIHEGAKVGNVWISDEGKIAETKTNKNELSPLFVVDGKIVPANPNDKVSPKDLDPETIAKINVLKGEAALEKYGSDGANGVVEIITKEMEKKLKKKQKALKGQQKELKTKQKELKIKQKELKAKQKEKEIKREKLATVQPVIAGKEQILSPVPGLSIFPNPTRQLTNIQLNLEQKGSVKVDIINANGQLVLNLVNKVLDEGLHQFQWNSDTQPAGSYFIHFNLDGELLSKQVMVKK